MLSPLVADVIAGRAQWALVGPADAFHVLDALAADSVDHVITDPPYSEHVHGKSRRGGNLPDAQKNPCRISSAADLGFPSITPAELRNASRHFARLARRWTIVFSDAELSHEWRSELAGDERTGALGAGLDWVRFGAWVKENATPQFSGDRPAAGFEAINIAHRKGRKKWNGGGSHAVWAVPVVQNRNGHRKDRMHTTQKPIGLMCRLVEQFTDPGDLVLDPFAGSGTTGAACARLGRRFIGVEIDPTYAEVARERIAAEASGLTLDRARAGQIPMFGGAR